ncbi:GNAT family N-acetyltransferase [Paenibacillus alvei]|uniref:GNAT family N-acetyltransferase n=1 Tax=Paenibacillus alvei TaxID=44250 RepID=UPI001FD46CF3|nr:GNAT family N-acetyltransferase [Paenibacillus alvei]
MLATIERLEVMNHSYLPILEAWFEDSELRERMDGMLPLQEWFDYMTENDMYFAWMAYHGEQPVGAIFVELEDGTAYIGLMTEPALRSQGIGKAMVREVMALPEMESVKTWVAGIEEDNMPCLACFKSLGYLSKEEEADEDGFYNLVYEQSSDGTA